MLEQKLIVNRFIDLTLVPPIVRGYNNGDFVTIRVQRYYLQESTGTFTKTSAILPGGGPKAHRNFVWLPWLPGAISEVPLLHVDVLTGPMSGCWLVTYRINGIRYAGHLGTDIANLAGTAAVNTAWNNFAIAQPGDVIGGFNPLRHWNGNFPARQAGEPANPPKLFGLYTTTNQFYILAAYQQVNPATLLRIAGIQQVPSVNLLRLQQVHLPGP
jgi:hypothetical protein